MSEGYIVRRGGNGLKSFAFITAKIPVNSTASCTMIDDGVTIYAKSIVLDTAGRNIIFLIPQAGTWTVSATDGQLSASLSFVITQKGQAEDATIVYDVWLYQNGEEYTDITGGWVITKQGASTMNKQADKVEAHGTGSTANGGCCQTVNLIDLTLYSSIEFITFRAPANTSMEVGITSSSGQPSPNFLKSVGPDNYETITSVDISDVEGSYYVAWRRSGSATTPSYLYKVRLKVGT